MAGKQDKISNTCPESCSLYSHSIAKVLLYVFVRGMPRIGYADHRRPKFNLSCQSVKHVDFRTKINSEIK